MCSELFDFSTEVGGNVTSISVPVSQASVVFAVKAYRKLVIIAEEYAYERFSRDVNWNEDHPHYVWEEPPLIFVEGISETDVHVGFYITDKDTDEDVCVCIMDFPLDHLWRDNTEFFEDLEKGKKEWLAEQEDSDVE